MHKTGALSKDISILMENLNSDILLKFMFFKKATKVDKTFAVDLMSNFVAFLENMNFTTVTSNLSKQ